MMNLLRPYPDELVGSMLSRASRQLGMPDWRMVPLLTGRNLTSHSTVLTCHAGVAEAFGLPVREFLERHTVFPYAAAFLHPAERERLLQSLCEGRENGPARSTALAANATRGTKFLRLCHECVNADMRIYGESYWRRSHQLPGVAMCLNHGVILHESDVELRRSRSTKLPNEVISSFPVQCVLPVDLNLQIAQLSNATLTDSTIPYQDWSRVYRGRLEALGYALNGRHIFVRIVATDLQALYGVPYLNAVDMAFNLASQACWPARMVRPGSKSLPPFCHILLQAFLGTSPSPSASLLSHIHQKKTRPRDWNAIEDEALQRMERELVRLTVKGMKATIEELLRHADVFKTWRFHRDKVPRIVAWIDKFRMSAQSARRTRAT